MSNVAKLKKEAADLEAKKQFDKALKVYVRLFAEFEKHPEDVDASMYNRVGDLQVKLGQVAEAVDTYEKGVDFYADGGFFNNAIALCNKILRQAPGRSSIYYKLGKISAQKGFKAEARQNFLEYADRMEKGGKTPEAFRALMEFLDLVPDQDDIRAMLAEQLIKADRKSDAVAQLQRLYERHIHEGRNDEAEAVAAKVRSLDPSAELSASAGASSGGGGGGDLIFLDLDAPARPSKPEPAPAPAPPPRPAAAAPPPPPPAPAKPTPPPPPPEPEPEPVADMQITRASDSQADLSSIAPDSGLDIEPTNLGGDAAPPTPSNDLLIEPTSFGEVSFEPPAEVEPAPARQSTPAALPPLEDVAFEIPGAAPSPPAGRADVEPLAEPEVELEPEPDLLDIGELPEAKIAPVIDSGLSSMDIVDLEPVEEEPPAPPIAPAPPPAPATKGPINRFQAAAKPPAPAAPPKAAPPAPAKPARPAPPAPMALDDLDLTVDDQPRKSTVFAAKAVNILQAAVAGAPEDWSLRRELAEAMLEAGDRASGLHELEVAMNGAENSDDLELAMALAEELGKLEPLVVKHHQKRVEYAFRRNDKPRLVEAYLTLGDALMQNEQTEKARAVYQRVLELAPDNMQAQAAVETLTPAAPAAAPARSSVSPAAKRPSATSQRTSKAEPAPVSEDGFVNLGDWLRDDEGPKDTRMVVDEKEPTGDEDADFADMLKKFKQGVAENVDAEDYQSHYDLAIAFKEMGLLDEAIAGFQKALGSKQNRLPTYEALGECFLEKGQAKMAGAILNRAINETNTTDDHLVGVLYLLGRAAEEQGQAAQALEYYQRVFVIDIQFKDVADRMAALDQAAR